MTRDPAVLLQHVQLCLDRIADYAAGGEADFLTDTKTQDAVIRNLEIIGQAVRDCDTESLSAAVPEIPWKRIAVCATCWRTSTSA